MCSYKCSMNVNIFIALTSVISNTYPTSVGISKYSVGHGYASHALTKCGYASHVHLHD